MLEAIVYSGLKPFCPSDVGITASYVACLSARHASSIEGQGFIRIEALGRLEIGKRTIGLTQL
jgi:hypothetical protein